MATKRKGKAAAPGSRRAAKARRKPAAVKPAPPPVDAPAADEPDSFDEARAGPTLVAIGASAGGLEALKELLPDLPAQRNYSYVIAQHLSPSHTSMMRDLLRPSSQLPVQDLIDGTTPRPGTVYIVPPNHDAVFSGGQLRLLDPIATVGPKPSIDRLLLSVADQVGPNSVGIILSGTGSDGAVGMRAIKAAGGITIAQDPVTAKYDGMPRAAVQTGSVDVVVSVDKMGETLENVAFSSKGVGSFSHMEDHEAAAYGQIGSLVKSHTGFSLAYYKPTTVNRRILRRMGLRKIADLEQYAQILEKDRDEALALSKDILISVTSFFRDPAAFSALEGVMKAEMLSKSENDVYRVWVAGCASGEEAYTIAIQLAEIKRQHPKSPDFLLFATDLDREAVNVARVGVYPESLLEQMTDELRKRYFDRQGNTWQVKKFLRQNMVFAPQNAVDDPPFSRIDLLSCRNLLIYFERDIQKRVLQTFHYAMNQDGHLFLGASESIELHKDLFSVVNKRARIFKRRNVAATYPMVPKGKTTQQFTDIEQMAATGGRRRRDMQHLNVQFMNVLTQSYAPPTIAVDDQDRVLHFMGDLDDYLRLPQGAAEFRIYDLLRDQFRAEARALIHRCRRERVLVRGTATHAGEEKDHAVQMTVRPMTIEQTDLVLLSFELIPDAVKLEPSDLTDVSAREGIIITELERELAGTRQQLQTVVEELETSNEELQSQSEELQSSNEELQSTNEELQTSNEELQSTNEELLTVNDELQSKSHELEQIAALLLNVKNTLPFPILVMDRNLNITEFNERAQDLAVTPIVRGSSMPSIDWSIDLLSWSGQLKDILKGGRAKEVKFRDKDGTELRVSVAPFRHTEGDAAGLTLCFLSGPGSSR